MAGGVQAGPPFFSLETPPTIAHPAAARPLPARRRKGGVMWIHRLTAIFAAASMAASSALAADLDRFEDRPDRRSGAGVGAYLELPFGGPRDGRVQAGLRMTSLQADRDAPSRVAASNTFDLRLVGDRGPTLYVAGTPVTGEEARRSNLFGGPSIVTVAVLALAAVGAIVIWKEIDDDDSPFEQQ